MELKLKMCFALVIPVLYLIICYISSDMRVEFMPFILTVILGFIIDIFTSVLDSD